jgi:Domain of unknown function (DUF4124)
VRMLWLGCLALLAYPLWGGEVYRSVDENGNVRYSDRPEGPGSERVQIVIAHPHATPPPAPTAAQGAAPSTEAPPATSQPGQDATAATHEPTAAEKAEERKHNCDVATERLERYQVSHRLYRSLPDGGREYLTDEEIDEARSKAAAEVDKWCN